MITLTLLHPIRSTPVQSWSFEQEPVIRIGRASDNHVILYSAVVSRHHVELRQVESRWEIINLGANGTYLNGKQITQVPVTNDVIIRLARSGPNIQIHLGSSDEGTPESELAQVPQPAAIGLASEQNLAAVDLSEEPSELDSPPLPAQVQLDVDNTALQDDRAAKATTDDSAAADDLPSTASSFAPCLHQRATADMLFCPDCGQPLQFLAEIGEYRVVKTLSEDEISITHLVWRDGQSLLLKTPKPAYANHPAAVELFERQAKALLQFSHPGIPRFVDFFALDHQPYLVMEQVHGQTLQQWVATQGPLVQSAAIATILQVCTILDYLHNQTPAFVHQDLKPENLIQRSLARGNQIILTGFVSLNPLRPASDISSGYLAPEQQQGQATPASDLFALGPILVYLLTGQHPSAFYAHREQGFRFYPEYVPGLMPELVAIIRRLTNPIPEERQGSVREVADALSQLS